MFLDPNFLYDAGIPAAREQLRQKLTYSCLHRFSGLFDNKLWFWAQNMGRGGTMLTPPTNSFLRLGVVISVPLLTKNDQEMRS